MKDIVPGPVDEHMYLDSIYQPTLNYSTDKQYTYLSEADDTASDVSEEEALAEVSY